MCSAVDAYVIANAAVLIDDRVFYVAALSDAEFGNTFRHCTFHIIHGLIKIRSHDIAAHDRGTRTDADPDADDAVLNPRGIDDASFGDDGLFEGCATDFCRGQHACSGIDGIVVIEQVEGRDVLSECQVGLKE